MKRFTLTRGSEVLAEGVVWSDGRATTCASRYWLNVEEALRWLELSAGAGVSIVWIDETHEAKREPSSSRMLKFGSAPERISFGAASTQGAIDVSGSTPEAVSTGPGSQPGMASGARAQSERRREEPPPIALGTNSTPRAPQFALAKHRELMAEWRERNDGGDCGRVATALIRYIDEVLVPVEQVKPPAPSYADEAVVFVPGSSARIVNLAPPARELPIDDSLRSMPVGNATTINPKDFCHDGKAPEPPTPIACRLCGGDGSQGRPFCSSPGCAHRPQVKVEQMRQAADKAPSYEELRRTVAAYCPSLVGFLPPEPAPPNPAPPGATRGGPATTREYVREQVTQGLPKRKLPTERGAELLAKSPNKWGIREELSVIWKVLDERLGRAP
jgi:hypothetical protein